MLSVMVGGTVHLVIIVMAIILAIFAYRERRAGRQF
jgi:hypothetical protein